MEMIPDELTQHTPPSSTAASGFQPSSRPRTKPGSAFSAMSVTTRDEPGAQSGAELGFVVLEAEGEQQEQHTDLGGDRDELLADVERDHTTLADDEAGDEVERHGGDADAPGEPRQDGQRQHDGADLDERERRL